MALPVVKPEGAAVAGLADAKADASASEGAEAAEPADADTDRSVPKNPKAAGKKSADGFRLSPEEWCSSWPRYYFFSSFFRRFSRFFSFFLRSFSSTPRFTLSARR